MTGQLASEHAAAVAGEVKRWVDEETGGEGGYEGFFETAHGGAIADNDEVVPQV